MNKYPVSRRKIKMVILVGGRDFGRCRLASRLPTALWPVAGRPVIERLLNSLAAQGIDQAVICSNGDSSLLAESFQTGSRLKLRFLDEPSPVGTAGCIRDAVGDETDALIMVFSASIISPPKIDTLITAHRNGRSDLTVMFNPGRGNDKSPGESAGIYICETSVMEHVPKEGYFDIKEALIPEVLRAGKTIHPAILPNHVGNFRDRRGYLCAVADYLENNPKLDADLKLCSKTDSQVTWSSADVTVDPKARIYGPVVIMDGAHVSEGALVFGPAILGRNVSINKNSVVANSVLWDDAQIGANCEIQRCVVDYSTVVRRNTIVEEKSISFKAKGIFTSLVRSILKIVGKNSGRLRGALQSQFAGIDRKLPDWVRVRKMQFVHWFAASLVMIAFLWSYWPGLVDLWGIWQRSDEYSSGILVPFLVVYVLWSRRHDIAQCPIRPSVWGLFAFVAAQAVRLFGLFFMYGSAERLSVVLSVAALVLLLFGWQLFRKVSTILLFLCLMLPWPNRIQAAVALPLQRWATSSAIFCLEIMGYGVVREGNIIHIGDASVAVAEACNGLRMITAFFVISGLVVLVIRRAKWEKLIIFISSLPIALLCNTTRLTVTAIAFTVLKGEHWAKIFHDFGGYAMMPLALLAVVAELWLLKKLTTLPALPTTKEAVIIARQK